MTSNEFVQHAKTYGYDIRYTGIGMAFITLGDIKLTETMDDYKAIAELSFIGMAIIADDIRTSEWSVT